jgi:hypothetical protein
VVSVVLAHQGGWDEILLIVGPMAVVVVLLRLAKRRVDQNVAPINESTTGESATGAPSGSATPHRDDTTS